MTLPAPHPPSAGSGPLRGAFEVHDGTGRTTPSPDPLADIAERLALLAAVGEGRSEQVVRLLRPAPTAAFSRRDALLPGFREAEEAARRRGFAPVVRPVGGRMAPYHRGCLVLDVVGRSDDPRAGMTDRFEVVADAVVAALRDLGASLGTPLDARVGAVPREYCPGEHSVHLRPPAGERRGLADVAVKVAGAAQRQTRRAYLVSTLLVVEDPDPLRAVVEEVYAALGLDLDPATVGAVTDRAPGATVETAAAALVSALGEHVELVTGPAGRVAP